MPQLKISLDSNKAHVQPSNFFFKRSLSFLVSSVVENLPPNAGDAGSIPGSGRPSLEEEMATHSNILAWRPSWIEEPSRLQSMGSQRVGHD